MNNSNTLFNLGDRAAALYEELTAERVDEFGAPVLLTEEQQIAIIDAYLEAEGRVEAKVDGYCALIAEFEMRAAARDAEANRLAALATRDVTRGAALRARLKLYFEFHQIKKMETPLRSLSIIGNGGVLPVLISESAKADDVDERFQRTIPARVEFDKDPIRRALQAGEELDFATLGTRGTRLSIK